MFFFRHPKPVVDGRAVAVMVVQQKAARAALPTVLTVDMPERAAEPPAPAGGES
jgi:hypothetical protein